MNIWIRSQNRLSLKQTKGLNITTNDNGNWYIEDYSTDTLATYKSKERCIEILDEIQNIINAKTIIKFKQFIPEKKIERIKEVIASNSIIELPSYEIKEQLGVIVYEMPEE